MHPSMCPSFHIQMPNTGKIPKTCRVKLLLVVVPKNTTGQIHNGYQMRETEQFFGRHYGYESPCGPSSKHVSKTTVEHLHRL